jgi:hypothetical protein
MRVSIGGIFAKCACGGDEFSPAPPVPGERRQLVICVDCASEARYGDLIEQIGKEAVRRAQGKVTTLARPKRRGNLKLV